MQSASLCTVLLTACPHANAHRFTPLRFGAHPWLQSTILPKWLNRVEPGVVISYRQRIVVDAASGGSLALEWLVSPNSIVDSLAHTPIVVMFPGLGACSSTDGFGATLMAAIVEDFASRATPVRVAGVVYPGFAGHALDSHRIPGSAYVSATDVGAVLACVRACFPTAPLVVIGASFGSALVSNWCARNPVTATSMRIDAVLLYAYGHSIAATVWAADHDGVGGLTGRAVVRMWKATFLDQPANRAQLERLESTHRGFDIAALSSARSVREWDTACLPLYGFETLDEMLEYADPVAHFASLPASLPVVIINAEDDWISPASRLAEGPYAQMPNVAVIATPTGGHLGWIDGLGATRRRTGGHCQWLVDATLELVVSAFAKKLI